MNGRDLLLVEDDESLGFLIKDSLDASGWNVSRYPDGETTFLYDAAGRVRNIPGVVNEARYSASGNLVEQFVIAEQARAS